MFSHCISRQLEEDDFDLLAQRVLDNAEYPIRITNEAMETHYIDKFSVYAVYHPIGTSVFISEKGQPLALNTVSRPNTVFDRLGNNVLRLVETEDSLAYRSGDNGIIRMMEGHGGDWLDVTTNVPERAKKIRLTLRWRNTLLSTILLYDIVLGSQGIDALRWTDRMDNDPVYASQFRKLYREFSGIAVCVKDGEKWTRVTSVQDVGPLAWKTVVVEIPSLQPGELAVRLQFVPDNVMLDMIAFDVTSESETQLDVQEIAAVDVRDNSGAFRPDVLRLFENDDDSYLITNPGESFRLNYRPQKKPGTDITILVHSKGYYTEWIRGSWIKNHNPAYQFDLHMIDQTIAHLAQSWMENRLNIEERFFNTRVPIREIP